MAFSLPSLASMELVLTPPLKSLLLLVLLAAPLFSLLLRQKSGAKRRRFHPVSGTFIHQMMNFHRLYDYHTEISRRRKSFRILTSPFHSEVYTNDPAVVEHILSTNFQNYGKGAFNYDILKDLVGDGIFAVDGEKWRHQRKMASYEFSTRSLKDISTVVFKKNCVRLATAIAEAADTGQDVDLQELFLKHTLKSIFEVFFGVEPDSLESTSVENSEFVRALDESNAIVNKRYIDPLWKLKRFFNVGTEAVLKNKIRNVDDYVLKLIRFEVNQMSKKEIKHDILSRFLSQRDKDPASLSDGYLRDILVSFILAGKDTTASTLSWFFYLLCKNPAVEEKILDEIMEAVGGHGTMSFEEVAAKVNEQSLTKMMYLHATLTETLRLYPALPMDGKICFSDDTLPDGYFVRAGELVVYQPYCMARMKELWGEDAEVFRPERWLDAEGNFCPESPFKFASFQAGPRICLGKDFAYRQMKIFAAVLLYFFRFDLRDEKTARYQMTLTLLMDPGLNVRVYRR